MKLLKKNLATTSFVPDGCQKCSLMFTKEQRMVSALTFLQSYHDEGDEFLDKIVTGDETWVKFVNVETKEQSRQWMHTHSTNKPRKLKKSLANRKLMATVFWDRKRSAVVRVYGTWNHDYIRNIL
jgi:hypothetical protein